jgi:putative ATPase
MAEETYYQPTERGFEREIKKRLASWQRLREKARRPPDGEGGA